MEEASKNCDTEKLGALSEACGQSMSAQMKTCTDECKEMFKFMGEADGCGGTFRHSLSCLRLYVPTLSHSLARRQTSTTNLAWETSNRFAMVLISATSSRMCRCCPSYP